MSREIKFRAWDGKQMFEVGMINFEPGYGEGPQAWDYYNFYDGYGGTDSRILMEFTGLKDKNGVEIYEGDLLVGNSSPFVSTHMPEVKPIPYPVTFENGCFTWRGEPLGWDTENEPPEICLPERWATVVGNIYANPELKQVPA